MQHKYETTRAQAKLQERQKDYINYMSARKLHKHPKLHERKKIHKHPKLHERKQNYKSAQNYMSAKKTNLHVI